MKSNRTFSQNIEENDYGNKEVFASSKYFVNYENGLVGIGGFADVYVAVDKTTGEEVALKKIHKLFTEYDLFLKEMKALLQVKAYGGHPHISGLIEYFEEEDHFIVIMDLVRGGEMFDHLVQAGAYSEANASRFLREVASSLAFLHGIGVVHADLKPEHLMLSNTNSSDAVIKIVDFGCAEVPNCADSDCDFIIQDFSKKELLLFKQAREAQEAVTVITPAYCSPEVLNGAPKASSTDMFALGIIVYVMLTGEHPFDIDGTGTNDEIAYKIRNKDCPPLRDSSITAHLSLSAINLIERLMDWDVETRLTAQEVLDHPWIKGETAKTEVIVDSDKKLSTFRKFQSHLEAKVFANIISFSSFSSRDVEHIHKRTSLLELAFQKLDTDNKGFLNTDDIVNDNTPEKLLSSDVHIDKSMQGSLSLSEFTNLLSQNMKSLYFPKDHIVYHEGDIGHHLYFINSGVVQVSTKDGSLSRRHHGDFFGEGALFHPNMTRSATIKCVTPTHTIQVRREYIYKYVSFDSDLKVDLREKDILRKRDRAKTFLQLQGNLKALYFNKGDYLFREGENGNELYILEEGSVDVTIKGSTVFSIKRKGDVCGEHSLIMGKPRNAGAICTSAICKVLVLNRSDFQTLLNLSNSSKKSLREMCLRREVRKALVTKTGKSFPSVKDIKFMFDAADTNRSGAICVQNLKDLLFLLDPGFSNDDIYELLDSLGLDERQDGVTFQEFRKIFGMEA